MRRLLPLLSPCFVGMACNQPPVIEQVGDQYIAEAFVDYLHDEDTSAWFEVDVGQPLVFQVIATDPEGDPIHYAAGPLPAGAAFDEHSGRFEWVPSEDAADAGWYDLYVVAMDEHGAWDSTVVGISVQAALPPAPAPPAPTGPRRKEVRADDWGQACSPPGRSASFRGDDAPWPRPAWAEVPE